MRATQAGMILGTAAYMSPEQASGKPVDKRSDIWSFGVILYEMLAGQRLFQGESAVEILGGVLTKEPDISAAPASRGFVCASSFARRRTRSASRSSTPRAVRRRKKRPLADDKS